jgi:O-antigen ligase
MKMALGMIKDNPILGVGTGNFVEAYNRYLVPEVPRSPYWMHNTYLQVWAENGTLGILAYLSIYVVSFLNLYKAMKLSRDRTVRVMSITFLSLLIGLSLSAAVSNVLTDELYWLVFTFSFIILGLSKRTVGVHE